MSKAAGTLITTNNATYIPPRFMPGYDGHVPTLKFDYGETYGNGTVRYFQDFRYHTMGTSRENPNVGGYFATAYSHEPNLAIEARTRRWERWLQEPRYRLTHQDHDRIESLIDFAKSGLAHREHYNDKTGTVHKIEYYQLPTPAEQLFRSPANDSRGNRSSTYCNRYSRNSYNNNNNNNNTGGLKRAEGKYTDDINLKDWDHQPQLDHYVPPSITYRASSEERNLRDLYFPNRHRYAL